MKIDQIKAKLPHGSGIDYTLQKLDLEECTHNHYVKLFGFPFNDFGSVGHYLMRADFLEKMLSRDILHQETRDGINFLLALEIYPKLSKGLEHLAGESQYGWLKHEKEKVSKIWILAKSSQKKYEKSKKEIKDKEIFHKLLEGEAQKLESEYTKTLSENPKTWQESDWGSPKNRGVLKEIGVAWALAGNYEKAENYLEKAGPWEWESAIAVFEKTGQKEKARKFCLLRAKHPTGYFEDLDRVSARCYEKAGELEKALQHLERSAAGFRLQEGSYDLHGDPKPGIGAAEIDEENAQRLRNKLNKPKGNK